MNKKIRIFIGSSTESLKVASAIKTNFEYDNHIEVRIWNESIFQPGQYTFDELIRFTKSYDFAIFVWAMMIRWRLKVEVLWRINQEIM